MFGGSGAPSLADIAAVTDNNRNCNDGFGDDEYERARRHYTTTKDVADKLEMEDHAKKHLMDMMSSVKDIWHEASPELRQRMKADITNLANELN